MSKASANMQPNKRIYINFDFVIKNTNVQCNTFCKKLCFHVNMRRKFHLRKNRSDIYFVKIRNKFVTRIVSLRNTSLVEFNNSLVTAVTNLTFYCRVNVAYGKNISKICFKSRKINPVLIIQY